MYISNSSCFSVYRIFALINETRFVEFSFTHGLVGKFSNCFATRPRYDIKTDLRFAMSPLARDENKTNIIIEKYQK